MKIPQCSLCLLAGLLMTGCVGLNTLSLNGPLAPRYLATRHYAGPPAGWIVRKVSLDQELGNAFREVYAMCLAAGLATPVSHFGPRRIPGIGGCALYGPRVIVALDHPAYLSHEYQHAWEGSWHPTGGH